MFFDTGPNGGPWGEPRHPACKSCRMPILADQRSEEVRFPDMADTAGMSGLYHAECARPFASIARAMQMLGRFGA